MALNNRRHLSLGLADPPILIPQAIYTEALEKNRQSLVGRLLSPKREDLSSVIFRLPFHWGIDHSQLHGRIIGNRKFQFFFEKEEDLELVLWSGPYTYNGWLIVLQKWEEEPGPDFLQSVPMWVKITGIPIRYLCEGTIRAIGSSMGEVMEVELFDHTYDYRFVRVRVNISVDTRLCYKKVVRFESGEIKIVNLRYEDIARNTARFKHCYNCGALNHYTKSCSHAWVDVPDPYERSLSPPPPSHENNAGLDGIEEEAAMAGTSSEGSKRKFEAVEEDADDNVVKRRSDETL